MVIAGELGDTDKWRIHTSFSPLNQSIIPPYYPPDRDDHSLCLSATHTVLMLHDSGATITLVVTAAIGQRVTVVVLLCHSSDPQSTTLNYFV